jgi:hypothetical protein
MTFGKRKSIVWKSWRRRKLKTDLTYEAFQMKGTELIMKVSPSTPFEDYGATSRTSRSQPLPASYFCIELNDCNEPTSHQM